MFDILGGIAADIGVIQMSLQDWLQIAYVHPTAATSARTANAMRKVSVPWSMMQTGLGACPVRRRSCVRRFGARASAPSD
mgnify:CR=1 FL=1